MMTGFACPLGSNLVLNSAWLMLRGCCVGLSSGKPPTSLACLCFILHLFMCIPIQVPDCQNNFRVSVSDWFTESIDARLSVNVLPSLYFQMCHHAMYMNNDHHFCIYWCTCITVSDFISCAQELIHVDRGDIRYWRGCLVKLLDTCHSPCGAANATSATSFLYRDGATVTFNYQSTQ